MKTKPTAAKRQAQKFRRDLIAAMAYPEVRTAVYIALREHTRDVAAWGRKFEAEARTAPGVPHA